MTQRRGCRRVADRRGMVRMVVLTGALAGLFAMHGLSGEGTAHHERATAPMDSVMVAMDHQSTSGSATSAEVGSGSGSAVGQHGDDFSPLGVAGLCLAVLAGALVGGLLLRPSGAALFAERRSRMGLWGLLPEALRDRDPPCLIGLSVQRC